MHPNFITLVSLVFFALLSCLHLSNYNRLWLVSGKSYKGDPGKTLHLAIRSIRQSQQSLRKNNLLCSFAGWSKTK